MPLGKSDPETFGGEMTIHRCVARSGRWGREAFARHGLNLRGDESMIPLADLQHRLDQAMAADAARAGEVVNSTRACNAGIRIGSELGHQTHDAAGERDRPGWTAHLVGHHLDS